MTMPYPIVLETEEGGAVSADVPGLPVYAAADSHAKAAQAVRTTPLTRAARALPVLAVGIVSCAMLVTVTAQPLPPIIDMHLHAMAANAQGPPPLRLCAPPPAMPAWDPAQPFLMTFLAIQKQPACSNPVVSPMTDAQVMNDTLAVLKRRNAFGVLSGDPDRVASWMSAGAGRFFPADRADVGTSEYSDSGPAPFTSRPEPARRAGRDREPVRRHRTR